MKKILLIGDSNMLPYNNKLKIEDLYVYKIKKFLKNKSFHVEQVSWGGITSSQLINFSTNYYRSFNPNFIIIHTGINDVKTQLLNTNFVNKLYTFLSLIGLNKKFFKNYILYNSFFLKFYSQSKVCTNDFLECIKKLKVNFKFCKILCVEVHANSRIDFERPGTLKFIKYYNKILKETFLENFITVGSKKNYF